MKKFFLFFIMILHNFNLTFFSLAPKTSKVISIFQKKNGSAG